MRIEPANGLCAFFDCDRPAVKGGWCWAHSKQRQRGLPLRKLNNRAYTAWPRLYEAALDYADAETEQEFDTARHRLMEAALAFAAEKSAPPRELVVNVDLAGTMFTLQLQEVA